MGGGTCQKYLKRRWNIKEGRGHKNLKQGGQAGSRGRCLKRWGLELELLLYISINHIQGEGLQA